MGERKTQSIQFKRNVPRELDSAGVEYKQDYCQGIYSTDFFIERGGKRIVLACKANVERGIEKAAAMAELISDKLKSGVIVVAAYLEGSSTLTNEGNTMIISLSELLNYPNIY